MRNKTFGNTVIARDGEPFEKVLRKFKKKIQDSGLLQDLRDREFYEKPTTARKKRKSAAKNRWAKYLQSQKLPPRMF
jgi:small subunit ribosomal protein S21